MCIDHDANWPSAGPLHLIFIALFLGIVLCMHYKAEMQQLQENVMVRQHTRSHHCVMTAVKPFSAGGSCLPFCKYDMGILCKYGNLWALPWKTKMCRCCCEGIELQGQSSPTPRRIDRHSELRGASYWEGSEIVAHGALTAYIFSTHCKTPWTCTSQKKYFLYKRLVWHCQSSKYFALNLSRYQWR